jgi:transposase
MVTMNDLAPKTRGRKSKRPKVEDFVKHRKTMTREEMAKHYGVSVPTIARWLQEFREELSD